MRIHLPSSLRPPLCLLAAWTGALALVGAAGVSSGWTLCLALLPAVGFATGRRAWGAVGLALALATLVALVVAVPYASARSTPAPLLAVSAGLFALALPTELRRRAALEALEEDNAALQSARDAVRHATQAKSRFLAAMSHELRTPMNGVLGMSALLQRSELAEDQRATLGTIQRAGTDLLVVVNQVLDFAKLEAGSMSLESVPLDPRKVVSATLRGLAPRARQEGVALSWRARLGVPAELVGDPARLARAVELLARHALRQRGAREVSVGLSWREGGLEVVVLDDAEPTFSDVRVAELGGASTLPLEDPSAMGLQLAAWLVALQGGRLRVEPVERGSAARFLLPLAVASEVHPVLGEGRVLVASRREVRRVHLGEILDRAGASCRTVATRAELAGALDEDWDLVCIDEELDGGGREAALAAAGICERIVLLSERPPADVEALGLYAALATPLDHEEVVRLLSRSLGRGPRSLPPLSARRVLLAEDNPVNQLVATRLLEEMGLEVVTVSDGRAAVAAVEEQRFDLVLMDCQMPLLDGPEATRRIRARGHDVPVVALTAQDGDEERRACLAAGMDAFLAKPFRPEQLSAELEPWLGRLS